MLPSCCFSGKLTELTNDPVITFILQKRDEASAIKGMARQKLIKFAMEAIDLLEKRIAALELQVLPENSNSEANKTQTITDLLIQTQTMITSALSCREAITSILQHMTTINEYLDPALKPANSRELEQYAANNLSLYEESRQVTMKVLNSLQQYNDIQTSLKTLFAQLDQAVTDLEKALKPKFSTEE
nr:unnamed protein product [Callosobruchus analis]